MSTRGDLLYKTTPFKKDQAVQDSTLSPQPEWWHVFVWNKWFLRIKLMNLKLTHYFLLLFLIVANYLASFVVVLLSKWFTTYFFTFYSEVTRQYLIVPQFIMIINLNKAHLAKVKQKIAKKKIIELMFGSNLTHISSIEKHPNWHLFGLNWIEFT